MMQVHAMALYALGSVGTGVGVLAAESAHRVMLPEEFPKILAVSVCCGAAWPAFVGATLYSHRQYKKREQAKQLKPDGCIAQ